MHTGRQEETDYRKLTHTVMTLLGLMVCPLQAGEPGKPVVYFIQSESEGLRVQGWWCKSQSESESMRTRGSDVPGQENMDVPAQAEREK